MKTFAKYGVFAFLISACQSERIIEFDFALAAKNSLTDVQNYYHSLDPAIANDGLIKEKIEEISARHSIKVSPLTFNQFMDEYAYSSSKSGRTQGCGGRMTHFEIVDEGGGCFGIVRQYENGSATISAYCRSGGSLSYQGYYCFE